MAASNNADLYEAVFQSWGLRYERRPFAFIGKDRPPPYYSNLTVLSPNCRSRILPELEATAKRFDGAVGFKDSFAEFDAAADGFELLFSASWIWRAPASGSFPSGWSKVERPDDLEKWELAWKRAGSITRARMFRRSMLRFPHVVFLGKVEDGDFACGCVANVSSDCVGLSNLFFNSSEEAAFEEATEAAATLDPRLPIVGYAPETRLEAAVRSGYERTGELSIFAARGPRL
jgi:hypothetical protein